MKNAKFRVIDVIIIDLLKTYIFLETPLGVSSLILHFVIAPCMLLQKYGYKNTI
ncbi:MAG: hypothetical protein SOV85_00590 [Clostridium sp.]|uniref:hypothetical protein n=1 Tax=Clostridium sp. TaxID=1506 RepID=UPI002A765CB6|nr:hypothetical protein [Clostridium sp.]MDY2629841.1 hypothetical protein [Clostridium sp.]